MTDDEKKQIAGTGAYVIKLMTYAFFILVILIMPMTCNSCRNEPVRAKLDKEQLDQIIKAIQESKPVEIESKKEDK